MLRLVMNFEVNEAAIRRILFDCWTYGQVAEEFQIPRKVLRGWIQEIKATAPRDSSGRSVYDELADLQREYRRLQGMNAALREETASLLRDSEF